MVRPEDIFYYYEIRSTNIWEMRFRSIIQEFFYNNAVSFHIGEYLDYVNKFIFLRNFYIYGSEYSSSFFQILSKHGYLLESEIRNAIVSIGNLGLPDKSQRQIDLCKKSPYIDDITFDGVDVYRIYSNLLGEFSFKLASSVFKDNQPLMEYMNGNIQFECHANALKLLLLFGNLELVTCRCKYFFPDTYYYHSFAYSKEQDLVIDLCSKTIMKKDEYYKIFKPVEIFRMNHNDFMELYNKMLDEDANSASVSVLDFALCNEVLMLDDNPEKEKIENFSRNLQSK